MKRARCWPFLGCMLAACAPSGDAERIAGCYTIEVGNYVPDVGEDRRYFMPPAVVELTTNSIADSWMAATPGLLAGGPPGSWEVRDSTVVMEWTDGTTGVRINGTYRHDSIIGTATPVSDIKVPDAMMAKARMVGTKRACPKPKGP